MRNFLFPWLLCVLLYSLSCQKENPETSAGKGTVKINIGLFISINEVPSSLKAAISTDDFWIGIFDSDGEEVISYARACEMPTELPLQCGSYKVIAHSGNDLPAAFDNPYYYGESQTFTVDPGATQVVTVSCELANAMVTIVYADHLKERCSNYETRVSSSRGSLLFTKDEIRAGYFQVPHSLSIAVTLTWEKIRGGSESKVLTGSIISPQAKKHYEVHVDANEIAGAAGFQISLNEEPIPVEVININDSLVIPEKGPFSRGDLVISEIMYDPQLLSDAEGEWIEIYNNTTKILDIQNLVIRRNDTESHIIENQTLVSPHGYVVLARNELAFSGVKYVYGTAISLNNTGAVITLANYGSDGQDGTIVASLNYGSSGFVKATGASLCLNPIHLGFPEAEMSQNWCVSQTPFSTGDKGTPGYTNDVCPSK
jgi:hypothetical protein